MDKCPNCGAATKSIKRGWREYECQSTCDLQGGAFSSGEACLNGRIQSLEAKLTELSRSIKECRISFLHREQEIANTLAIALEYPNEPNGLDATVDALVMAVDAANRIIRLQEVADAKAKPEEAEAVR